MVMTTDLASKLRPQTLQEFIGQSHIIGKEKALYKLLEKKRDTTSLFLWKTRNW